MAAQVFILLNCLIKLIHSEWLNENFKTGASDSSYQEEMGNRKGYKENPKIHARRRSRPYFLNSKRVERSSEDDTNDISERPKIFTKKIETKHKLPEETPFSISNKYKKYSNQNNVEQYLGKNFGDKQSISDSHRQKESMGNDASLSDPALKNLLSHTEYKPLKETKEVPKDLVVDTEKNRFRSSENLFINQAVASEVPFCSEVGIRILNRGGDAVDAGIATTLCVGIVNNFSSGIGGGGFALFRNNGVTKNGVNTAFVDFRETAPSKINDVEKGPNWSEKGVFSIGIPGEIRGLYESKIRYSTSNLKWEELFDEAISLARNGFKVSKELALRIEWFKNDINMDKGMRDTYFIDGKPAKAGQTIIRENLAKTLEKIAKNPQSFYQGDLMRQSQKFIEEAGGLITKDDFENYKVRHAVNEEVPSMQFEKYKIFTTGLPSSGSFLIFAFNVIENMGMEKYKSMDKKKQTYMLVEIMKYMFANRGKFEDGNEAVVNKELKRLVSKQYAKQVYDKIMSESIQKFSDYEMASFNEDFGTTQVIATDKNGAIFSINSTVNLQFGSKMMDPATGILFNNELNDFYIAGQTSSFGKADEARNKIEPNKRPFSSMCPIILESDNDVIAVGAAGGSKILTSVLSTTLDILSGETVENSVKAPKFHHQGTPYKVLHEAAFDKGLLDYLKQKGNDVAPTDIYARFTSVQGIRRRSGRGIEAFSDLRKGGEAAGNTTPL